MPLTLLRFHPAPRDRPMERRFRGPGPVWYLIDTRMFRRRMEAASTTPPLICASTTPLAPELHKGAQGALRRVEATVVPPVRRQGRVIWRALSRNANGPTDGPGRQHQAIGPSPCQGRSGPYSDPPHTSSASPGCWKMFHLRSEALLLFMAASVGPGDVGGSVMGAILVLLIAEASALRSSLRCGRRPCKQRERRYSSALPDFSSSGSSFRRNGRCPCPPHARHMPAPVDTCHPRGTDMDALAWEGVQTARLVLTLQAPSPKHPRVLTQHRR